MCPRLSSFPLLSTICLIRLVEIGTAQWEASSSSLKDETQTQNHYRFLWENLWCMCSFIYVIICNNFNLQLILQKTCIILNHVPAWPKNVQVLLPSRHCTSWYHLSWLSPPLWWMRDKWLLEMKSYILLGSQKHMILNHCCLFCQQIWLGSMFTYSMPETIQTYFLFQYRTRHLLTAADYSYCSVQYN